MRDNEDQKNKRIADSERKIARRQKTVEYYQHEKEKQKSCMKKFFLSRRN